MMFLFLLINAVNAATFFKREFWTTIEIVKIDWKDNCLIISACTKARFYVSLEQFRLKERQETSFPIYEDASGRIFSSHWRSGFPEDILLSTGVTGIDPEYKFPRHCAATPIKTIFPLKKNEIALIPPQTQEVTVMLTTNCYNITIVARKFIESCPWCPKDEPKAKKQASSLINESHYASIIIMTSGIIVVICILTLILTCFYYRKRFNYSSLSKNPSIMYSSNARQPISYNSSIPPPPFIPPPPSSADSSSTVIIQDDTFYEQISVSPIVYKA